MTRKKILVVDDDEGLRRILGVTLGEEEFELRYAGDGEEAIVMAAEFRPDLVLLDVMMPNVDGFQVCQVIKSNPKTRAARVVMLTASATEKDRARGRAAGADEYFGKPFSPTKLLNRIYELLDTGETSPSA